MLQVAATWFPEDAAPGSMVLFPTMDSDPGQRFFGHDFLHVLPPTKQLQANILRRGPDTSEAKEQKCRLKGKFRGFMVAMQALRATLVSNWGRCR